MGRAVLFKMMALPRLLYVMQNTPYLLPEAVFRRIEAEQRRLLWGGISPRIALSKLQRGIYDGGLAVPDLRKYYWATQLININGWVFSPLEEPAYRVDRHEMGKGSYLAALYHKGRPKATWPVQTATVVTVWHKANKMLGWRNKLTAQTPLWEGNVLPEVSRMQGFRGWKAIGIDLLGDIWKKGHFMEFSEFQKEYKMGKGEFLHYLQLSHAVHCHL